MQRQYTVVGLLGYCVLVKVVALKIDTVVAVPELLREEKMLALLLETQ